jgi:regulator of replication initiation timing
MLDDRIAELEDENAALQQENAELRAALDNIRTKIAEAATGDCRKLHDFERIAFAMKEAKP